MTRTPLSKKIIRDYNLIETYDSHNGYHYEGSYSNGYGVSIIKNDWSYGRDDDLWEIALIKEGEICYEHDFNDVIGYLTEEELEDWIITVRSYE